MNPIFLTLCASLQVALLYLSSPWLAGAMGGTVLVAMLGMFAWTREHWDGHLDMMLIMLGPGGLGMMLATLSEPQCHLSWRGYWLMTAGMLAASLPLSWASARCLLTARQAGQGSLVLLFDIVGMQAGMTVAHLSSSLLPMTDPRSTWIHHALMALGMSLGMLAAMLAAARLRFTVGAVASGR